MMSEQIRSSKQELAHVAELMASTEAAIIDAADPFPWQVSLDGLRVRRLQLTEKLVAELEAKLAMKNRMLELIGQAFEIFEGHEWILSSSIIDRVEAQARAEAAAEGGTGDDTTAGNAKRAEG